MSSTHDVTISAFDLDRIKAELAAVTEQRDKLVEELDTLKQSILDLSHPNMKLLLEERKEAREQRDRLAEALKDVMKYRKGEKPYDYWRLPESHRGNAQFDGWNEIEDRINAALASVEGGSHE